MLDRRLDGNDMTVSFWDQDNMTKVFQWEGLTMRHLISLPWWLGHFEIHRLRRGIE